MTTSFGLCLLVGGTLFLAACDAPAPVAPAANVADPAVPEPVLPPSTRPADDAKPAPEAALKDPDMTSTAKPTAPRDKPPPARAPRDIEPAPFQPPAEVDPVHVDPGDEVPR